MYTLPAEVMPTLQAHRACEHTVLAQDAGNNWFALCPKVLSSH